MHHLKPIARESIPRALAKAERYRLLNEPAEAESICRDVLAAAPGHAEATACLALALTDMFGHRGITPDEARRLAAALPGPFERAYFTGVVEERWAKALLEAGYPPASVQRHIAAAMDAFEDAQSHAQPGNDDATLRWNSCVRLIERHGMHLQTDEAETEIGDHGDVPAR